MDAIDTSVHELIPGAIWLQKYPLRYAGCDLFARASYVRLQDGGLWVHSPGPLDEPTLAAVTQLGDVTHIVAPGSFHHLFARDWHAHFPKATLWICPGVEQKQPELDFDWFLADRPPEAWEREIDQVLVRGNRLMWEVAFFHKSSKTLILTDLIENIGDETEGTNWVLRFWWKAVMHMWNEPKPAPEYQLGWKDKVAAKHCLERILKWDFERVVIAHGENLEADAKAQVLKAWAKPLAFEG